jgi:hypothetical protein
MSGRPRRGRVRLDSLCSAALVSRQNARVSREFFAADSTRRLKYLLQVKHARYQRHLVCSWVLPLFFR